MNPEDLDAVYTDLCRTMTEIGETKAPLFLARFALLAIVAIGSRETLGRMIEAAAEDLA
ncbi:MAG TPA: hypothetical protein VMU86_03800 [Steroidobacteraceae bacterium]|nr:hypothetical protein [Steroidobacteraceae bacterium]